MYSFSWFPCVCYWCVRFSGNEVYPLLYRMTYEMWFRFHFSKQVELLQKLQRSLDRGCDEHIDQQAWRKLLQTCSVSTPTARIMAQTRLLMATIFGHIGISLHNPWRSETAKYYNLIKKRHGKKALHGLVYIKGHVHTLDRRCPAWGTLIRNIQSATVQDWKSKKGSEITTASLPHWGGLKEAVNKYWSGLMRFPLHLKLDINNVLKYRDNAFIVTVSPVCGNSPVSTHRWVLTSAGMD